MALLKKELNQLYEEIYHLQNCELALGEYFQQLGAVFPNETGFWETAAIDEINHAMKVGKLIALVSSNQALFGLGRYRLAMLETYLGGIYENIEKLMRRELSPTESLKIALDYEDSILETRPYDVVSSSSTLFREFKDLFQADLGGHSEKIRNHIQQNIPALSSEKPAINK